MVLNVYDFDNTIYDGESIFDFFIFLLKKKPGLILHMPVVIKALLGYKLCRITEEELIETAEIYIKKFFRYFDDIDALINEFWDKNMHKIKKFYLENKRSDDLIITASWDKLIAEIAERIGINNYIASSIDEENFKVRFLCYRENKVEIFKETYKDKKIENFYSDSKNDIPMMEFSENAYIVKGKKIIKVK